MTRKSPIRHPVKQHLRQTKKGKVTVQHHMRGHGKHKIKPAKLQLNQQHQPQSSTNYYVTITYTTNIPTEIFIIPASSYPEAIETAMTIRVYIDPPHSVEVTRQ